MTFDEDLKDFLIESNENLESLDRQIVELEQNPQDQKLLASIFRTIHTIKGTCGFFDFPILGSITHIAENLLSQAREKQREVTPSLISLVLETVDGVRTILRNIEDSGAEGPDIYQDLHKRLEDAYKSGDHLDSNDHRQSPAEQIDRGAAQQAAVMPSPAAVHGVKVDPHPTANSSSDASEHILERYSDAADAQQAGTSVTAESESRNGHAADTTIRVDVGLLDKLMNLVGELVLARNQLLQDTAVLNSAIAGTSQRLNLITSELQEGVMKTRMQPIGVVWNKLPRVVRDLASECGKKIQVEMDGAGTELDRTIIEAIKDPLTHIVRNSCDHGIELPEVRVQKGKSPQGKISLRAYHEGGHVNIELSDDGAGINTDRVRKKAIEKGLIRPEAAAHMSDPEAVQLIFHPGFSTAEKVTSISGRGVGMDVVRTNIERIGGSVDVFNKPIHGMTVRIKIPLTLAIIPGLVVTLHGQAGKKEQRFVISQTSLLELVRLEGADQLKRIESVHGTPVYHHRGKLLPLVYLGRVLGREVPDSSEVVNIVLLQAEDRQLGLVVDDICDTQEIVVKPLGKQLRGLSCYMGATIMGDGKIALILDVSGLARLAGIVPQSRQLTSAKETVTAAQSAGAVQRLLLFRTGRFKRLVVPLSTVARLEKFDRSRVEYASGSPVIHYRDQILPLISLISVLDQAAENRAFANDELQVVVFTDGQRSIGLVVEQIEDIIEETITIKRASSTQGLLGSAVVAGKITDFLDLHTIVKASGDDWLTFSEEKKSRTRSLLLIDPSAAVRELLRSYLEMSGYDVREAADTPQALAMLTVAPADVVVSGINPFGEEGRRLIDAIRGREHMASTPVVTLLDKTQMAETAPHGLESLGFDAWTYREDREALLQAVNASVESSAQQAAAGVTAAGVR